MRKKGNFLMYQKYGSYAFLNDCGFEKNLFVLYDLGKERRFQEKYYFDNTNRTNYSGFLFQCTQRGEGFFEEQGKRYALRKGRAFLVRQPSHTKYYLKEDAKEPWEFFYLHFDGQIAEEFYQKIQLLAGNVITLPTGSKAERIFEDWYAKLNEGWKPGKYEEGLFIHSFLVALLMDLEEKNFRTSAVEQGYQWIKEHYKDNFSMQEIADKIGITLSHFTRQFKEFYDITPGKYQNQLRLEYAMRMMLNTELSVEEISRACGFQDANYFSKVFRKGVGMSPTEYRQSH